jgi:hypothetical protein
MNDADQVELTTFGSVAEADIVASALQSAGFECSVRDRFMTGSHPEMAVAMRGVGLLVARRDVEAAREFLATPSKAAPPSASDEPMDCAGCGRSLPNERAACPDCNSLEDRVINTPAVQYKRLLGLRFAIVVGFLALFALPVAWDYFCNQFAGVPESTVSTAAYTILAVAALAAVIKAMTHKSDERA